MAKLNKSKGRIFIVHSIDTEGPLYESHIASFERLKDIFGLDFDEPTPLLLNQLKAGEVLLGGLEDQVRTMLSSHLSTYMSTWDQIDSMLSRATAPKFRNSMLDSAGNGWVYNWHIMDHVGFVLNPRRRDMGYHNIYDHYTEYFLNHASASIDQMGFHYHPISTYREAHRCATSYSGQPELYEILSRRIIERSYFPSSFRAGFQAERPDSHLFLEQWIPFDLSNMSLDDPSSLDTHLDFKNGRSGNWRQAPSDWSVYHPDHDNYQIPGQCRRLIARSLNVLNRIASIDQDEVDKAFITASTGQDVILGFASHDFRDIGVEVEFLRTLLASAVQRFPEINYFFSTSNKAFREIQLSQNPSLSHQKPVELELKLNTSSNSDVPSIDIHTVQGSCFGPQPYLAIETKSRRFIHDNLDFGAPGVWHYAFHMDTIPLHDVRSIGIGTADQLGNTYTKVISLD
jgi:hypothetical protein